MRPLGATAILLPLVSLGAAPAAAQLADAFPDDRSLALIRPALEAPPAHSRDGLSFRIGDQFEPDGTHKSRRGIIAGIEVAPDTLVGIGLFETLPKRVNRADEERLDKMPKRSRKAAVGLTLKF